MTNTDTLGGDVHLLLAEFDDPPNDPIALLRRWLADARGVVREPGALVLSTVDRSNMPSSRVVLLKELDDRRLLFTTHTGSRKAMDIEATGRAAATLHWRETLQQVNIAGAVERLDFDSADALLASRPRAAQAATAVSEQGAPLESEKELADAARALEASEGPISRPGGWGGYRLVPDHIEFWHGSVDRLHRRLAYVDHRGVWTALRLQP